MVNGCNLKQLTQMQTSQKEYSDLATSGCEHLIRATLSKPFLWNPVVCILKLAKKHRHFCILSTFLKTCIYSENLVCSDTART